MGQTKIILIIVICAVIFAALCALAVFLLLKRKKTPRYYLKNSLMTHVENEYYKIFDSFFGDDYIILPQINLASVIEKEGSGYRNELFRNVDFGVFDFNYRPILLIEINDSTHLRKDRISRDKKVNAICKKARIPLVTFRTSDGIDRSVIYRDLKKYL